MRKSFVALLLLAGAAATLATAAYASDDVFGDNLGLKLNNAQIQKQMRSSALRQGVSSAAANTLWVGYSTALSPAQLANNYWSIGPGPNRPLAPSYLTTGVWQWDPAALHGDSLYGWTPVRYPHTNASGAVRTDNNRPWWAAEIGNTANATIALGRYRGGASPWPGDRTWGVVGVWHADPGNSVSPPAPGDDLGAWPADAGVKWAPLVGGYSAWMGLRQHGDHTVVDPITGNPFNVDAMQFTGTNGGGSGSSKTFPGYGSQMDQMLYRDVNVSAVSGPVTLSMQYATRMSTGKGTASATRTGWFEGDPLGVPAVNDGNLISAEAGTPANSQAPIDSFQVYIGKPVEGTWVDHLGNSHSIFDPLRRWFNEVLDKDARFWLFGAAGTNNPTSLSVTVTADMLTAIKTGGNDLARIVIRVHTNAGSSDESGTATYTSGGRGAAQVDDVVFDGSTIGTFENGAGDNTIDNDSGTAWHSTGKPPNPYFHPVNLTAVPYNDICTDGIDARNSPFRICDMRGVVIDMGDYDSGGKAGPDVGAGQQDTNGNWGMVSPAIGLIASSGVPNDFGLTLEDATPTQSYTMMYEGYWGYFDFFNEGNAWQFGAMAYPALQMGTGAGGTPPATGTKQWGEVRLPQFLYFNPLRQCYPAFEDLSSNGQILSANGSGLAKPDSLRLMFRKLMQCYRVGLSSCAQPAGSYVDNVSLVILDGTPQAMAVNIWDLFQDTFPFNENDALAGLADFDTCAALIRTGLNAAQTVGDMTRFDVPADSVWIQAADHPDEKIQVHMVFRIKPGVGNYITIGQPASGLRRLPTSTAGITPGDGSFWSQYSGGSGNVANSAGEYCSPGYTTAMDSGWPGGWNPNVWRSARCDTSQVGLFPVGGKGYGDIPNIGSELNSNYWMSTYHESDPHWAALTSGTTDLGGIRKQCFNIDPTTAPTDANIICGTAPAWAVAAGWGGAANGDTWEGVQIIPDGLLTPGAHVEYFFRKALETDLATFDMCPDTNTVFTQPLEGSFDAHRWQEFSVLPDRWKHGLYGGEGDPCMLYIDWNDRRGDERVWVSTADSIGATSAAKRGAHNGWGNVPGGVDINNPAFFIAAHGGSAGSTWDMYGVKASESLTTGAGHIGARLSYRDNTDVNNKVGSANANGEKYAKNAPTPAMMEAYYSLILLLSGDLNSAVLGPFDDRSADDVTFLQSWLLAGNTLAADRGIMVQGDGFMESAWNTGNPTFADYFFCTDYLGEDYPVNANDESYRSAAQMFVQDVDLIVSAAISPAGDIYGVRNACFYTNDVLLLSGVLAEAVVSSNYEPSGVNTFIAGIHKPWTSAAPWVSVTDGFDILQLTGRFDVSNKGRLAYYYNVMSNIFAGFCTVQGSPTITLDTPNNARYVNFVKLGNNPVVDRQALVVFQLARTDRVQIKVFDVTGRLVRTLADRTFEAGDHRLTWDGVDDHGTLAPRGVYFTKTSFVGQNFQSANKMIVLN